MVEHFYLFEKVESSELLLVAMINLKNTVYALNLQFNPKPFNCSTFPRTDPTSGMSFNVCCTDAGIIICLQTYLIFHIPAVSIRFVERVGTELVTISLLLHLALYLKLFQFTN